MIRVNGCRNWAAWMILAGAFLGSLPVPAWALTVYAKDYGYTAADATAALQAAINSGADRVVVSNLGTEWVVTPIRLGSHQTLAFEPGVVVRAKSGAFHGVNDCLFWAQNQTDIAIEGNGAVWQMRKADYSGADYIYSQWRHTLRLLSCSRVAVSNLTLRDSGGDGVFIGSDINQPPSRDVTLSGLLCDNHYRQGISVTDVENLALSGSVISNTNGTDPQTGIDFEPDYSHQRLVNCRVRDCRFENNAEAAILVYPVNLLATSPPVSITFENCYVTSRAGWGVQISPWPASRVAGTVSFINCLFEDLNGCGLYAQSKAAYNSLVRFDHCTWRRVAKTSVNGLPRNPFCVTGEFPTLAPEYGGVEFRGCVLEETEARPAMIAFESTASSGCANVFGNLYVTQAGNAQLSLGAKAHDIALKILIRTAQDAQPHAIAYPNPARGTVYFQLANPGPETVVVSFYNIVGERVWRQESFVYSSLARIECQVSALPPGIYYYLLRRHGESEKGKICLGK